MGTGSGTEGGQSLPVPVPIFRAAAPDTASSAIRRHRDNITLRMAPEHFHNAWASLRPMVDSLVLGKDFAFALGLVVL